jgi:hypothetical protein
MRHHAKDENKEIVDLCLMNLQYAKVMQEQ